MPAIEDLTAEEADLLGVKHEPPEEQEAREKSLRERARLRERMLRGLMDRPQFREWLMDVLVEFDTFGRTFGASPSGFPDDRATEFHLGRKAAGWRLWTLFDDLCPELASQMRREFGKTP